MTETEQKQFSELQQQLAIAQQHADQTRAGFLSALDKSNSETRFYQGIFWCALLFAVSVAIFALLQR